MMEKLFFGSETNFAVEKAIKSLIIISGTWKSSIFLAFMKKSLKLTLMETFDLHWKRRIFSSISIYPEHAAAFKNSLLMIPTRQTSRLHKYLRQSTCSLPIAFNPPVAKCKMEIYCFYQQFRAAGRLFWNAIMALKVICQKVKLT